MVLRRECFEINRHFPTTRGTRKIPPKTNKHETITRNLDAYPWSEPTRQLNNSEDPFLHQATHISPAAWETNKTFLNNVFSTIRQFSAINQQRSLKHQTSMARPFKNYWMEIELAWKHFNDLVRSYNLFSSHAHKHTGQFTYNLHQQRSQTIKVGPETYHNERTFFHVHEIFHPGETI